VEAVPVVAAPVAVAEVPSVAVAKELPVAAAEQPPVAAAEELPTAAAEVPPVAVAEVPPVAVVADDEPPAVVPVKPRPPKKPNKATPPARVSLTLVLFLVDAVELKIGRKMFMVERKVKVDIEAGRSRVKWRLPGEQGWHDEGRQQFSRGHHYLVRLHSARAPEIIDTRSGGTK